MKQSEADNVEIFYNSTIWLFIALACLFALLAAMYGPLLSFWMFINSLQLILHLPLINVYLPATANFFMLRYLLLFRLHIAGLNNALEAIFGLDTSN